MMMMMMVGLVAATSRDWVETIYYVSTSMYNVAAFLAIVFAGAVWLHRNVHPRLGRRYHRLRALFALFRAGRAPRAAPEDLEMGHVALLPPIRQEQPLDVDFNLEPDAADAAVALAAAASLPSAGLSGRVSQNQATSVA